MGTRQRLDLSRARALLDGALANRAFPGCVLGVGWDGAESVEPFGRLSYDGPAPVAGDSVYDIASLTKVVATSAVAMVLVERGLLDLDAPLMAILPECRSPGAERVRIRHLLTHSSGWRAWAPLHLELQGKDQYLARIASLPLAYEPGSLSLYSDLGFILLGAALERVSGRTLDVLAQQEVLEPLRMRATTFCPPKEWMERIAPTELDPWRGRMLRGEVHDENAYAMGGVAPHAGLFSAAADLGRLAGLMLRGGSVDGRRFIAEGTVDLFTTRAGIPGSTWALGWDTPTRAGYSAAGTRISERAFGGLGFTGTSLWIDQERGLYVVLLTNRVHPTRENEALRTLRPAVMDAIVEAVDASAASSARR
jgi:CubicO group peptidase (beta-lactamase class C family)